MRLLTVLIVICAGVSRCRPWGPQFATVKHPAHKFLAMDCSNNPPCPEGETCTCLPGTYHPEPSFVVDDRWEQYTFGIRLEKGWTCEPDIAKDKQSLTVTCTKRHP
jgi:hypothetical protein